MASPHSSQSASDREIIVSRTIEGPRRLVFEAFTDVAHLARWWGPNGFTTTTHAFEFRPGGVWDFIMHGPDGVEFQNWIEWREIVPPERIYYLHGDRDGDPRAFASTVTLAPEVSTSFSLPTAEMRSPTATTVSASRIG